ncbi:hypothetical protein [Aureispira anguillae]|uniref:EGF-like domain-containing protein n=1 Tax=Aureispira anguillae TaxID=2864201 RepID=A0A915YET6_9BACT|nr:hypothetical protein [Aureispira anguillae]BDS11804.1 hypothetical protein AsAng_0025180 [Aureispira anguillae]
MQTLMNSFKRFTLIILGAIAMTSCDPCSGVICTNGTCSNGTCVCEPGYERNNSNCIAVNQFYVGTGTVTATLVAVDVNGNSNTTNNVGYTLNASTTDPYVFTLVSFNGLIKNDISFKISDSNHDVIIADSTTTSAGNAYTYSGGKVGNQVQLVIKDTATETTYTVAFVA